MPTQVFNLATALALVASLFAARMYSPSEVFAPYLAMLFGAGFLTRSAAACVAALAVFLVTDLLLGTWSGSWMILSFTVAFYLVGAFSKTATITVASGFIGITAFYLVTNAYVWYGATFYPQTFDGLMMSYVAGWPFYRAQLFGLAAVAAALYLLHGNRTNDKYTQLSYA